MKAFLIVLCLLVFVGLVHADVFVLYDTDTFEVKSAINKDQAVNEPGWEKVVLPGKLKDYGLTKHPQYYKFVDGSFIQDNEKISKQANDKKKGQDYSAEIQQINSRILKDACELLESEGVKFKEIDCNNF